MAGSKRGVVQRHAALLCGWMGLVAWWRGGVVGWCYIEFVCHTSLSNKHSSCYNLLYVRVNTNTYIRV